MRGDGSCALVCVRVCVYLCVCVSPLIKPVSGLVIKMHYHPTVSREETNSLSLCLLSCLILILSFIYSLTPSLRGVCRGGGEEVGGGSLIFLLSVLLSFNFLLLFQPFALIRLFLIVFGEFWTLCSRLSRHLLLCCLLCLPL